MMPRSLSNTKLSKKTQKIGLADMWAECRKSECFLPLWGTKKSSIDLKISEYMPLNLMHPMVPLSIVEDAPNKNGGAMSKNKNMSKFAQFL